MAQHNTIARGPAAACAAHSRCGSALQQTCTTDCATIVATVNALPDCVLRGGDRSGFACACRRVGMPRSFWPAHEWCRGRDCACRPRPGPLGRPQGADDRKGRTTARATARSATSSVARSGWTTAAARRPRSRGSGPTSAGVTAVGRGTVPANRNRRRRIPRRPTQRSRRNRQPRVRRRPNQLCPPSPGPNPQFPQSGGGGGGAVEQLPRYKPPSVPDMQLPGELQPAQPGVPGGTAALEAGAGVVAAAAPVGAAVPIALPVIVAPPLGLGIGGGGGGAGAGPRTGPAPDVKSIFAQPPAGRSSPPANVGSNAAVPNASYRIGYTEYLRTAGLPQVAALAVPGLVGIMVLTGAGGLVGYRQAKAGHAVRVGGSARFMR